MNSEKYRGERSGGNSQAKARECKIFSLGEASPMRQEQTAWIQPNPQPDTKATSWAW